MRITFSLLIIFHLGALISNAQDSTFIKINKWLNDNNFAIRQTFDGSKNENKPASFIFKDDFRGSNDFIDVDLAVKISEWDILKNTKSSWIFYPKIEWHNSGDTSDVTNNLDGGINFEFLPFNLKGAGLPVQPENSVRVSPWIQGSSSFKRNFINNVYETKLTAQLSFVSNFKYFPGFQFRDSQGNFRARYYPYFGIEYNKLPDFLIEDQTEEYGAFLVRIFAEIWILPQALQLNIDGTYREIFDNNTNIRSNLPLLISSLNLYPGKQESFGVGFEYKHGYESDSRFQLIEVSSLKLAWKI